MRALGFEFMALVRAGDAHCVLALGFEFMTPVALGTKTTFLDRPRTIRHFLATAERAVPDSERGAAEAAYFWNCRRQNILRCTRAA